MLEKPARMAEVMSWPGDGVVLNRVSSLLRSGQLVGISTETGFIGLAFGLDAAAVKRLSSLSEPEIPPAILLGSVYEIFDWVPSIRGAGIRLVRDFWPGPLELISALGLSQGLAQRLPQGVRDRLVLPEGLPLRLTPRDDLVPLLKAIAGPVVIASLRADSGVDVVLDVEPIAPTASVTVVAAGERAVKALREGSIRPDDLESSRRTRVVFVCTGNTCRSPMAGALCQRLLADTLGINVGDLTAAGFEIASAGMAAAEGDPASIEAVEVAQSFGADLSGHRSQPLNMELVDRADHLLTMTTGHLRMLQSLRLPVGPEPQLLSIHGDDVSDPIGGPLEMYRACAEQIRRCLRERLPQILEG